MISNYKKDIINFWEFLEIPMNSTLSYIKIAFAKKFEKIEKSIDNGEQNYTPNDLKICINAYETLSDPYKRFLHNCEINGEEPPREPDWDTILSNDGSSDDDLSGEVDQAFFSWLLAKANQYMGIANNNGIRSNNIWNVTTEFFLEVANKLYNLHIKEQQKKKKKDIKKNIKIKNKK